MAQKRINVEIPIDLLNKAQSLSGEGLTKTIEIALRNLIHSRAYHDVSQNKGRVKSELDLREVRGE